MQPEPPERPGAPHPGQPLHVVLELARQAAIDDPYAMPERPQTYLRRMADGGYQTSALRWSRAFQSQLAAVRVGAEAEARQQVGRALRRFLDGLGWAPVDARIQAAVAAGAPVVITLRSAAAELWRLPWALTTHGPAETHLGALPGVLIRLEWPETHTAARAQRSQGPERILVAWAAPSRPVPADAHIRALRAAAAAGGLPFDPATDVLPQATPAALVARLEAARPERPIAALHLLCHGGAAGDSFGLTFHGPDGAAVVDAGTLRALLAPFTDRVRLVVIAACDSGNDGPWAATLGSVAQALHRVGFAAVVASQRPLSGAGSVVFTERLYRALLVEPASVEQAFVGARQALLAQASEHADWAGLQLWARAADGVDHRPFTFRPYRGLLPFEAEHARFYFGRSTQRAEVLADLERLEAAGRPRFLVVAAASGTGKSSLVRAAVIPDLQGRMPGCQVAIIKPGLSPRAALERVQAGWADEGVGARVLVVDQFEEVFTLAPAAEVEPFCRALWALASGDAPVVVLVTLRVDFIGRCGQVALTPELRLDRVCYDEAHRVFVPMMAPADLRQAIEGPAARVGLRLADGLAARMLRDVGAEPGHLPLLQYALDQLWQRREGALLTHAAYEAIGGVTGALTRHADAVVDALADEARAQARRLLTELVDLSADREHATRRRVPESTIQAGSAADAAALAQATETLVEARMVFRSEDAAGAQALEITHEALIRRWDRLSEWVAQDREKLLLTRDLVESARTHLAHDSRLAGNQLGHALDVAQRFPGALPADVVGLIEASQAERDRSVRRRRLGMTAFIAFLVVTGLGMFGLWIDARDKGAKAQRARKLAVTAGSKAAQAEAKAVRNQAKAVKSMYRAKYASLLALALNQRARSPALAVAALFELGPYATLSPRARLLAHELAKGPLPVRRLEVAQANPVFAPDGGSLRLHRFDKDWVCELSAPYRVTAVEPSQPTPPGPTPPAPSAQPQAEFSAPSPWEISRAESADGRWSAVRYEAHTELVARTAGSAVKLKLNGGLAGGALGPDGAVAVLDGTGALWLGRQPDLRDWRLLTRFEPDVQPSHVAFVGRWVLTQATRQGEPSFRMWSPDGQSTPARPIAERTDGRERRWYVGGGVFAAERGDGPVVLYVPDRQDPRRPLRSFTFERPQVFHGRWVIDRPLDERTARRICDLRTDRCTPLSVPPGTFAPVGVAPDGAAVAWAPRIMAAGRLRPEKGYRVRSATGDWVGPMRHRDHAVFTVRFLSSDAHFVNGSVVIDGDLTRQIHEWAERGAGGRALFVDQRGGWILEQGSLAPGPYARLQQLDRGAVERMRAMAHTCLSPPVRAEWLGEDLREACATFAACEAGFGRKTPPPPACENLPPPDDDAPAAPTVQLHALRARNVDLKAQADALLQQAEALRETITSVEAMLQSARDSAP